MWRPNRETTGGFRTIPALGQKTSFLCPKGPNLRAAEIEYTRGVVTLLAVLAALSPAAGARDARAQAAPRIWADHGSYPPRPGNDVQMLVDGRDAYSEIAASMKRARKFVYATFSYADVDFLPVPEKGETMFDLLRSRRADGADVKLVIWKPETKTGDTIPDAAIAGVNEGPRSVQARWDRAPGYGVVPPVFGLNHQKTYVMDDGAGALVAFVGGINAVQSHWDAPEHDPLDARRVKKGAPLPKSLEAPPPFHDIFYEIKGPSAADVLSNFVERYNGASDAHRDVTQDAVAPIERAQQVAGGVTAQILRTIAPRKYKDTPEGDLGIRETYLKALNAAAKGSIVYIENQYFLDPEIISSLRDAAARGAGIIALLTSNPDEGTWGGWLESFLERVAVGALTWPAARLERNIVVMTLGNSVADPRDPGRRIASEIYVHSKALFVLGPDWAAMAGGSANIDFGSLSFHSEMDVALADARKIRDWAAKLWAEHLGIAPEGAAALAGDPQAALAYFRSRSAEDGAIVARGLAAPSRVFPFGTQFPAPVLAGVAPADFNLPAMGLSDVKEAAEAPGAPDARAEAPRADVLINLGEFEEKDDARCAAEHIACVQAPFDAAFARPEDKRNLVGAFQAALAQRAAGRSVSFDPGVDAERAAALEAALRIREASCGKAGADKNLLRDGVRRALSASGFRARYRLLALEIEDWIDHPERNAWLCGQL